MSQIDHLRIFVGHDPREALSYAVTVRSMLAHTKAKLMVAPLSMTELRDLYTRPTERRDGRLFDVISNLPMSTEFAIARFWVPYLCDYDGWALFVDGDWLFRNDVAKLFALRDDRYAVMVVKHFHERGEAEKMDGQVQKRYVRKLWSAMMLFNCGHPSCKRLDLDYLNHAPRHYLHKFRWCKDDEIGGLPQNWAVVDIEPYGYHLTLGTPELGVWGSDFDEEWLSHLTDAECEAVESARFPRKAKRR
jgi:hypothetical protein